MDHIVVYEENDLMRSLLREWLGEAGYQVSTPASGAVRSPPRADLVMISVSMPRQEGAGKVQEVRKAHPGARVIALSGQFRADLSDTGDTARTLGVEQVLAKPLSRTQLLDSIKAIMSRPANPDR